MPEIKTVSNAAEIEIEDDVIEILQRYAQYRPAKPELIIDMALRKWYSNKKVMMDLMKRKSLGQVFKYEKIPEKKVQKIAVTKDTARDYKMWCDYLGIDQCANATFLLKQWMKVFKIEDVVEKIDKQRVTEHRADKWQSK